MKLIILLLLLSPILGAQTRVWHNTDKTKSFKGKALSLNKKAVTLSAKGKKYTVPLRKLSNEDRVWLNTHFKKSETFWSFDTLDGWKDGSQNNSPHSYVIKKGKLEISTRAKTADRVKVLRNKRFGAGRYSWYVYVPKMEKNSQASIGAFLYSDDTREVDFEIGSGTAKLRKKLGAKADDLVCYLTSQGRPFSSDQILIKHNKWYQLDIEMRKNKKGKYDIVWLVNRKEVKRLSTHMSSETTFHFFCSLENLKFMGDHLPRRRHYALFDWAEFTPLK